MPPTMTRANEPASPVVNDVEVGEVSGRVRSVSRDAAGLTVREHFAAMAMQGLMMDAGLSTAERAACAVENADALLAALAQEQRR